MKRIEIVTYNYPKELHELATEMEMNFSSFEVTDRRIDILQRASEYSYKLDEENKRLREALAFYADKNTYAIDVINQWEPIVLINKDSGDIARQALEGGVNNGKI